MNAEMIANYIKEINPRESHDKKVAAAVRGFIELFPFLRVSLFAYSPLTFIGESMIRMDASGTYTPVDIREDVRKIPAVHSVVHTKRAALVSHKGFPDKYVNRFNLSSLIIVPVMHCSTVVGTIFLDRYTGSDPLEKDLLSLLEQYGKCLGQLLYEPHHPGVALSKRETEVMQQIAYGYSMKEIAELLGISPLTVRDYVGSALKKLKVKHRGQGIAESIRLGLIH